MIEKIIAVTGSEGFVGTNLVNLLTHEFKDIIKIDLKNGHDLIKVSTLNKIPRFDVIVHLAGVTSVAESFQNPQMYYRINSMATLGALELCRKYMSKFIYVSSYLYGNPQYLPVDENHPLSPHNPYANSKLVAEKMCLGYYKDFHIPLTILRPFNLYGPGMPDFSLIPSVIKQVNNEFVSIKDDKPKRDYLHIRDMCRAIIASINHIHEGCDIFNLGSGISYSAIEVTRMILMSYGENIDKIRVVGQRRPNEVLDCYADISKAATILNWQPKVSLGMGINDMTKRYRAHG